MKNNKVVKKTNKLIKFLYANLNKESKKGISTEEYFIHLDLENNIRREIEIYIEKMKIVINKRNIIK